MIPSNFLRIITIGIVVLGARLPLQADGDVTIVTPPATSSTTTPKTSTSGDTPVVHKSSHKKKPKTTTDATTATTDSSATSGAITSSESHDSAKVKSGNSKSSTTPVTSAQKGETGSSPDAGKVDPPHPMAVAAISTAKPSVETGLPVPRHVSTDLADLPSVPAGYQNLPGAYPKIAALTTMAPTTVASSQYKSANTRSPSPDFAFTDFSSRRTRNIYPWKTGIITTIFWIGEGGSTVSSTDNVSSSWDIDWMQNFRGADTPNDRRGYAPASHAATLNTFYIALPFNDLVYPDKARRWLPAGWHRPPEDGKPVSACKDRWVRVKNAQGRSCYAQWEDVGPLEYDNAEYVFGDGRPTSAHSGAGLDVSPAVAQYLGIDGDHRITSWQFVDEEDVPPGAWLKYDEEALLYQAMHMQSGSRSSQSIQRSADPNVDPSSIDASKQKIGSAKG